MFVKQVAEEKKMHLFFVSAKANSNVLETFVDMTRELVKKGYHWCSFCSVF